MFPLFFSFFSIIKVSSKLLLWVRIGLPYFFSIFLSYCHPPPAMVVGVNLPLLGANVGGKSKGFYHYSREKSGGGTMPSVLRRKEEEERVRSLFSFFFFFLYFSFFNFFPSLSSLAFIFSLLEIREFMIVESRDW